TCIGKRNEVVGATQYLPHDASQRSGERATETNKDDESGYNAKVALRKLNKRRHEERDYQTNSALKMSPRMVTNSLQINRQTWNKELAEAAKNTGAEECAGKISVDGLILFAHDPNFDFVKHWFQQHTTYTYGRFPTENYADNFMYTQIVWAATRQIGCHEYFCESYQLGTGSATTMYISVCMYSPKGNIQTYYPYATPETAK
ncbi:hypothetical protein T265_14793, partial [Opisthorchis viverrini]